MVRGTGTTSARAVRIPSAIVETEYTLSTLRARRSTSAAKDAVHSFERSDENRPPSFSARAKLET